MTDREFARFRDLIYAYSHIFCTDAQRSGFEKKLRGRIATLQLASFQEYYALLTDTSSGHDELTACIDAVAVHETSFFRNSGHFLGLEQQIFPQWLQNGRHAEPLRIWSAGCSTGEEPYSLVMTFLESAAHSSASKTATVEVVATDIAPSVLAVAQQGIYSAHQVQKIPPALLDKYFLQRHHAYHIREQVKQCVTWRVLNLAQLATAPRQTFDIIFCRNVLIYFDHQAQAALLEGLLERLAPGGYLFLGDAESIHTFPQSAQKLHFLDMGNAIIYQKREEDA
jgi:chemotaxis protein methyltransferase CheR